ncbi:MAG: LysR family transcriptional regulator [Sulfitobacter sp.]
MDIVLAMRSFVAVVQEGSMRGAGRQLGVTGALIGQRIAALEERLDTRLLNRSTRHQSLTEFGRSYYQQSLDILEMVALSEGHAAAQQTTPQGRLRVTAPVSFGNEALIPALPKYVAQAPDVQLDIVLSDQNLRLVAEGVDAAFRIGTLEDSDLICRPLSPYRMMVCAAPSYLEHHGHPRHPDDLEGHRLIGFEMNAPRPWRFMRGGQTLRWTPQNAMVVNSGQAARMAANVGLGIVMQPQILLSQDVASGKLIQLFKDWTLPENPVSLLYHRDRHMPLRLSRFIEFAMAAF